MARLIIVTGPTGAGKTTYSLSIAKEIGAIRFSIDPWMQILFSNDMTSLDYSWMIERVNRCYVQIWQVSEQVLELNGNVVLDLGFTTKEQRDHFTDLAKGLSIDSEIHYLNAPKETRKKRVEKRNLEKDPSVYSFEVTDFMFNFMEPKYEIPGQQELENGRTVNA
ncbi:ATP-binding protein [Endozoicomonas sp. OPT23]|uniref:AAA family ATPase n=1 Tax=Endozoicomonas sp. OPT23 TaxID=2072845 RepID=UPI00129AC01A|nr:ATP-binding protein [Endozoicomonas sp. OPT23]MRI35087.1 ATP-binding protein [Endozoicomonas sp. OPT23]